MFAVSRKSKGHGMKSVRECQFLNMRTSQKIRSLTGTLDWLEQKYQHWSCFLSGRFGIMAAWALAIFCPDSCMLSTSIMVSTATVTSTITIITRLPRCCVAGPAIPTRELKQA